MVKNNKKVEYKKPYAKAHSAIELAGKALTVAIATKKLLNVEKKFHDYVTSANCLTTGSLVLLNGIAQGDTASTRDGSQCKMVSSFQRVTLRKNAAGDATQQVRVILLLDKQSDAGFPNVSDIVSLLSSSSGQDASMSLMNLDNNYRFKIMKDKIYDLDAYHPQVHFDHYTKLQQKVRFSGTGSSSTDISYGGLYALFISSQATSNGPQFNIVSRIRYVDN